MLTGKRWNKKRTEENEDEFFGVLIFFVTKKVYEQGISKKKTVQK